MKRLWFALVFLAVSTTLCIGEQYYIKDFYAQMTKRVDTAIACCENGDKGLEKAVDDIQNYWYSRNDLIFTLTNHGVLDDLSAHIRSLNKDSPKDEMYKVKAILTVFYENQRITLANVF